MTQKHTYWALAVLLAAALPALAQDGDGDGRRTVAVTGTSITHVQPDIANWTVSLHDVGPDLAQAKASSDGRLERVLAILREMDIDEEDMQTGYLSTNREFEKGILGQRVLKHWVLSRGITFKLRDLTRFDACLAKLMEAVDADISYTFEVSNYHDLRASTRLDALRLAQEKAQAMCEALDAELGPVWTMSEGSSTPNVYGRAPWNDATSNGSLVVDWVGGAETGTFAAGRIEVRESVRVTFTIN